MAVHWGLRLNEPWALLRDMVRPAVPPKWCAQIKGDLAVSEEEKKAAADKESATASKADDKGEGQGDKKAEAAEASADKDEAKGADEAKEPEKAAADADDTDEAVEAKGPDVAAIAARVAALGEEDELDKIARAEEEKLAARRAKKGKKGGLESAASKRLAGIGKKEVKRPTTRAPSEPGTAAEVDDPLLSQTRKLSTLIKENQRQVTLFAVVLAAAAAGFAGYSYMERKAEAQASGDLSRAVADERGRIADTSKEDADNAPKDPRPVFKTPEERRESALKKYQDVRAKHPKSGAAILARLAEGSLLLDKKDADGAAGAFNDVKSSALATADAQVRGRALEGLGFAYELKSNWDEALKTYQEMERSADVLGFKELAMYHQARVLQQKGDKDKAKELLKNVRERLQKGDSHPFAYLDEAATDRLRSLDPSAVPPKPQMGGMGGMGGFGQGGQPSQQQLMEMIKRMQQQQKGGGGHP